MRLARTLKQRVVDIDTHCELHCLEALGNITSQISSDREKVPVHCRMFRAALVKQAHVALVRENSWSRHNVLVGQQS